MFGILWNNGRDMVSIQDFNWTHTHITYIVAYSVLLVQAFDRDRLLINQQEG